MRSSVDQSVEFDWKENCFLCCKRADKRYSSVQSVRTIPLLETFRDHCKLRGDDWDAEVQHRLSMCTDLVAEEGVYHNLCMNNFRTNIQTGNKVGRSADLYMLQNFQRVCNWLEEESDSELYTLTELHEKMMELSKESPCYGIKYLKHKLKEHYGDHIIFSELNRRPNIVCFKDLSWFILNQFKNIKEQSPDDIVAAAARSSRAISA